MSRRLTSLNGANKETRQAERIGKLMTEDFSIDLERVGYYLVRNLPKIVYDRFEVVALTAGEEYDKLMQEIKTGRPVW
jgi:hypothetical protein